MDPADICSDSFFKKSKPAAPYTGSDIVAITPVRRRLTDQYKFGLSDLGAELARYHVIVSRGMN